MKLEEMSKLAALLGKNDIPFLLRTIWSAEPSNTGLLILIPDEKYGRAIIDASITIGTYGSEQGLVEIMAHSCVSDVTGDDVIGWLDAEDAFEYIEKAYKLYYERMNNPDY